MYPLKFYPVYKERIWGSSEMATLLNRQLPPGKIGESWELSCHSQGMSQVRNGSFAGNTLQTLISAHSREIIGQTTDGKKMPLLVKILTAQSALSVQVHPDDAYAQGNEGAEGKIEAWYVLAARPGAQIVYGLKEDVTLEQLRRAVQNESVTELLRYVPVRKGDLIHVPSGVVHALGAGVAVYEIQQSSDTTYRIYDYNRRDEQGQQRKLHLDRALEVIDFSRQLSLDFSSREIANPYFQLSVVTVDGARPDDGGGRYMIYCVTAGQGVLRYPGGEETLVPGDTVLVPAALNVVELCGRLDLLRVQGA